MNVRTKKRKLLLFMIALIMLFGVVGSVFAASDSLYNMTQGNPALKKTTINNAIWELNNGSWPTGSGTFHAFLRVQDSPSELGHNSNWRPPYEDADSSPTMNYAFPLAVVPQLMYDGRLYREFQLDINENVPESYLSLDSFQVWLTDNPELHGYTYSTKSFPSGASKVYDIDGDGNTSIMMDYNYNTGSGKRDYRVLIPDELFDDSYDYVTQLSHPINGFEP